MTVSKKAKFISAYALVVATLFLAPSALAQSSKRVVVQPLGNPSPTDVQALCRDLEKTFNLEVVPMPASSPPGRAYYPPRKRYLAEPLLDWLENKRGSEGIRVLGVTDADISQPKPPHENWGIFGLAYIGTGPAVISTYRLKGGGGLFLRERLYRLAVHEMCHTFGIEHCSSPKCLMADSKGSIQTIDDGKFLCVSCIKALGDRLKGEPNKVIRPSTTSAPAE